MISVLGSGRCTSAELFIDGDVSLPKAYIAIFEQGPGLSNSCSSSSELAALVLERWLEVA